MPVITSGQQPVEYQLEGTAGAPVLVLSNSLGTTMSMWEPQLDLLRRHFQVLRYDTRGHGGSLAGRGQPSGYTSSYTSGYTLEQLGRDVLALLDALDVERAHFCGISMGGLTGLWLGVHAGHRLHKLVVANSAARIGSAEGWRQRAADVRASGMDGVADGAAGRWFTPTYAARAPGQVAALVEGLRACDPAGYADCCLALADADLRQEIGAIETPTLLIGGLHDPVTTMDCARFMQDRIGNALCVALDASHLSNVEAPVAFNRALAEFLI